MTLCHLQMFLVTYLNTKVSPGFLPGKKKFQNQRPLGTMVNRLTIVNLLTIVNIKLLTVVHKLFIY